MEGAIYFAVVNTIYVSNSHTKFGWISFNGKGEDSITDCDDARKYLEIFLRKVLLAYRSLQFEVRCLIYIFEGELHNLALTCKNFGFT